MGCSSAVDSRRVHRALPVISLALAHAIVQAMVAFTTITQGSSSQIVEPRDVVVRTADEWQALWKAHSPQPAAVVDLSRSIIIGVFLGSRPTAGYQVAITAIESRDGLTVVTYEERRPAPDVLVAQVLTSPFHLVSMPRVRGDVEFRKVERLAR